MFLSLGAAAALLPSGRAFAEEAPQQQQQQPTATEPQNKADLQKELADAAKKQQDDFTKQFGKPFEYNPDTNVDITPEMRAKYGMPAKAQDGRDYVAVSPIDKDGIYVGGAQGWVRNPDGTVVPEPMTLIVPSGALAELNKANAQSAAGDVREAQGAGLNAGGGDVPLPRPRPGDAAASQQGTTDPTGSQTGASTAFNKMDPNAQSNVTSNVQNDGQNTGTGGKHGAGPGGGKAAGIQGNNMPASGNTGTNSGPGAPGSQGGPPGTNGSGDVAASPVTGQNDLERITAANRDFHRAQEDSAKSGSFNTYKAPAPGTTVAEAPKKVDGSNTWQRLQEAAGNLFRAMRNPDDGAGYWGDKSYSNTGPVRTAKTTISSGELPRSPNGEGVRYRTFGKDQRIIGGDYVEKD